MEIKIDEIVKQVLSEVSVPQETTTFTLNQTPVFTGRETGKTAVLVSPEEYEIKEYALPKIGAKEILVQVEGCVVSPTDTAEFMKEKRVGQAIGVGLEGTGVIVKLGSEGLKDASGNLLKTGDRVIAVKRARGAAGSFRANGQTGVTASGWFSNYVVLQAGNQIYQVNQLDLESRMLTETVLAVTSAVERAEKLNKLNASKRVVVLGGGIEALITLAALKCQGIYNTIAIAGEEDELKRAKEFGAKETINFRDKAGMAGIQEKIQKYFGGKMADIVFHCTPSAMGKTAAKRFLKMGGSVCELGHVLGKAKSSSRYYEETMPVGGRFYSVKDYEKVFVFLEDAAQRNIPMYKLITHRYKLDEINEAHWGAIREEGLIVAVFNR